MTRVLVTGASGFIGHHLVKHLIELGMEPVCLVRPTSDRTRLNELAPEFATGDVTDAESVREAMAGVEVVYHLAGLTKALRAKDLILANEQGVRNIASCCAELDSPPVLVLVSSLAAAGPATAKGSPLSEKDRSHPVSNYGRSKRAGEVVALEYADRVPTTIVRPPIVLGEGDRDGFAMFETISKAGVHLVPGFTDHVFSAIHADDLASALVLAAQRGQRATTSDDSDDGIYFAAADETPTYAGLGQMIGEAVGRSRTRILRVPRGALWTISAGSELFAQIRRHPHILSLDKAREATAGSWACDATRLKHDTGFEPAMPLQQRLNETAQWYFDEGWLKKRAVNS